MLKNIPTIIILSLLAVTLTSCDKARTDVINVDENDAEMNSAMEKARETLPQFLQRRDEQGDDFSGLLKVYFTEPDNDGEHMWVAITDLDGATYQGTLLSEPRDLTTLNAGDPVEFQKDDISDWMFVNEGKAVGGYTIQVLRNRMTEEEREAHDAGYPFSFD